MTVPREVFGVDVDRVTAITDRHADAFENAERTIMTALALDDDVTADEALAVFKWASAVRFATLISIEGRTPTGDDFTALVDAVCVASS